MQAEAASLSGPTTASLGLMLCPTCRLISRQIASEGTLKCVRCATPLHLRKPDSLSRTWALLIAAMVLYIPANALPIMQTSSLFGYQSDTILSGILFLWSSGSWPLAVIVFIASFIVPLGKLLMLCVLLITVQQEADWAVRGRTRLYRLLQIIGRWSMLDIFVMTLLVAVVQLRSLAQIRAQPGAVAFASVVVLTMLATECFDPRLIWDAAARRGGRGGPGGPGEPG